MAQSPVSIRELKSRLSHYLMLIRNGESVVITDRGVPIGRIVPIRAPRKRAPRQIGWKRRTA